MLGNPLYTSVLLSYSRVSPLVASSTPSAGTSSSGESILSLTPTQAVLDSSSAADTHAMTTLVPASVVLYQEPNSGLPPWPSIYCTDDVAPRWFMKTRPLGYVTLVLKLSSSVDTSQLRWASTTDLSHFDPFAVSEATQQSTPGLMEAYKIADNALDSGLELEHWRDYLASDEDDDDSTIVNSEEDEDVNMDPQILRAIELSMKHVHSQEEHRSQRPSDVRTTPSSAFSTHLEYPLPRMGGYSSSPFQKLGKLHFRRDAEQPQRLPTPTPTPSLSDRSNLFASYSKWSKRPSPPSPNESDDELPSPRNRMGSSRMLEASTQIDLLQPSYQRSHDTRSPVITISDDEELSPVPRRRKSRPAIQSTEVRHSPFPHSVPSPGLSARQISAPNGLTASAASVPRDDIIEEDLGESSQFVQVYVGPIVDTASDSNIDPTRRRYKLQLLKHHIWDRPYFRDTLSARNYFEPVGENTWELVHPQLADILPEDFRLVAEYLSDDSFGIRDPETEEEVAEAFAECMSTWKSAELLSMDDLLEHIVEKVRSTRPWWDLFNVMLFACFAYDNDVPLQAHGDMKEMLSDFVAEYYDIYVEDDSLRAEFITRVKQLPELRRDIHRKIAEQIEQRLEPQREEAIMIQDEHEQQDMDLYRGYSRSGSRISW